MVFSKFAFGVYSGFNIYFSFSVVGILDGGCVVQVVWVVFVLGLACLLFYSLVLFVVCGRFLNSLVVGSGSVIGWKAIFPSNLAPLGAKYNCFSVFSFCWHSGCGFTVGGVNSFSVGVELCVVTIAKRRGPFQDLPYHPMEGFKCRFRDEVSRFGHHFYNVEQL